MFKNTMNYVFLYPLLRQNQQNIKLVYDMMTSEKEKKKLCMATPYFIINRDIQIHNEMKRFNYYRYIIPIPFPYQLQYESELLKQKSTSSLLPPPPASILNEPEMLGNINGKKRDLYFMMSFVF